MLDEELSKRGYRISSDASDMDVDAVHAYLSRSYWSSGIPKATVAKALSASLCFGLFKDNVQIGFARVVTDRATFAYLCDVYVLEEYQRQGLGKRLIAAVMSHPDLQGLRRFLLGTRDAHGLYAQFGFAPLANPQVFMSINRPNIYVADPDKDS
jgi:GNAT superfamily N-acetyltransferase